MPAPGPRTDAPKPASADGEPAFISPGVIGPWRYEFLVQGTISAMAARAFPELTQVPGPLGGTCLHGEIRDQSHLHGVLHRLDDLALVLVEVRWLPPGRMG